MSVCLVAIAKDEGQFIAEWLAHYIMLGVDRVFLFDNESTDATAAIVDGVARRYPVTRIAWPTPREESPQLTAYQYAIDRLIRPFDWACFFDCDEFLFLYRDRTLGQFLDRYDGSVGALGINWLSFGSSGRTEHDYELVTEAFRRGARRNWGNNKHIKTIARPRCLKRMSLHHADLRFGSYIHPDGAPVSMPRKKGVTEHLDHSLAQLNHYQTKSRADFDEKMRRGRAGKRSNDPTRVRQNPDALFRYLDRNAFVYHGMDATCARRRAIMATFFEDDAAAPARESILAG
jgi:hypothetical protein